MPKSIPTTGTTNWGTPLNNHLSQLNNPTNGGINIGTSDPTGLSANDIGYTYVNYTTRELRRWNGSEFRVLIGGLAKGREALTANRTYYVNNNTGNNSNDGLTSLNAFSSLQHAVDIVRDEIDRNGYVVTIQLEDSSTPYSGAEINDITVTIKGNSSNFSAVKISSTFVSQPGILAHCIFIGQAAFVDVVDLTFVAQHNTSLPNLRLLEVSAFSTCNLGSVKFEGIPSSSAGTHIYANNNSSVVIFKSYEITGGADNHIVSLTSSNINIFATAGNNVNINIVGNPNIGIFALAEDRSGVALNNNITVTGNFIGKRFVVNGLSIFNTNNKGVNFFPGTIAGTTSNGSYYL